MDGEYDFSVVQAVAMGKPARAAFEK